MTTNLVMTTEGEYLFGTSDSLSNFQEAYGNADKTDLMKIGTGTRSRIIPVSSAHIFPEITDLTFARSLMAPFYVIDCDEVITPP